MQSFDDFPAHERTYRTFNRLVHWSMVALGAGILWLARWFATPAGFLGASLAGLVAFVLGYVLLIRPDARQRLESHPHGH